MRRFNRSLLMAAVVASLSGAVALVHAGAPVARPSAQGLADEHWKYPHMHKALDALADARKQLDDAEDIFHGHKQEAQDHIDKAMKAIHAGLKEKNDDSVVPGDRSTANPLDDKYPHLRKAQEKLKVAKDELDASEKVFTGHRDDAISQTVKALKQINDSIGA